MSIVHNQEAFRAAHEKHKGDKKAHSHDRFAGGKKATGKGAYRELAGNAPCPICDKPERCKVRIDNGRVMCFRDESDDPAKNGGPPWYHPMPAAARPVPKAAPVLPAGPAPDLTALAETYHKAITPGQRQALADALRLPVEALKSLPIGYDGQNWTFPEVDAAGTVIGVALRWATGEKQVMTGSRRGLTLPAWWEDRSGPVFVCEGASDTLALDYAGLCAVGRPSNASGTDLLATLFADLPADQDIIVLGENDSKPNGRWPGVEGATKVAAALRAALPGRTVRVMLPPAGSKDARAWLTADDQEDDPWPARGKAFAAVLVPPHHPDDDPPAEINLINQMPGTPGHSGERNTLIQLISPVLGEDAYHGFAGEFLRAVAPYTEATDAGVLAHFLPAVGTLIGPGPTVFAGARQSARINAVLVGPTSRGRKGTAFVPVDYLIEQTAPTFWQTQHVGGLATGEGLVKFVADREEWDGESKETVTVPVEKRVMVVEPEFSRVLAQSRREGNILSQVLRDAFDSGNLSVLTRGDPLRAAGAHISVVGHITADELKLRMPAVETANGFGNRFLWFVARTDKMLARTDPFPDGLLDDFSRRLAPLANAARRTVGLDPDAVDLWECEIYPDLWQDRPGVVGAMTARGSAIVLRLALVFSMLDTDDVIRVEHLKAAMAVWRYNVESCEILFGGTAETPLADKLLALLSAGPMKRNQFTDHVAYPAADIEAGLKSLEASGLARCEKVNRQGGPAGGSVDGRRVGGVKSIN